MAPEIAPDGRDGSAFRGAIGVAGVRRIRDEMGRGDVEPETYPGRADGMVCCRG